MKPENIFTSFKDSNVVKIGDLGIATAHGGTRLGNRNLTQGVGTILYFPPEQGSNSYGKSVDIYALGIIFLELLHPSVQAAHNRNNYDPLVAMITGLRFKQVLPAVVSSKWPVASSIILKMTSVYPEERPKCAEILGAFEHNSGGVNSNDKFLSTPNGYE